MVVLMSPDFGITWDETSHNTYGRLVFEFYRSGFADRTFMHLTNTYNYGGFFDLTCYLAQQALSRLNDFDVRHMVTALFGWLGLLFSGLLARRLFGPWAGILAVFLLALSPRYMAHSMNNSKDLPFATLYVASLYCFSFVKDRFPYVSWRVLAACMLAPALAINIRVGGLLLVGYFMILIGYHALRDKETPLKKRQGLLTLGLPAYFLLTLVLGTVFWPWALLNPLSRPFEALELMSAFKAVADTYIRNTLFAGEWISTLEIPWDYLPRWIAITIPLGVLVALPFVLFLPSRRWLARQGTRATIFLLLGAVLFPPLYAIVKHSRLYDGWRHMLFIYPPLVVLAAGVWSRAFVLARERRGAWLVLALLLVFGCYHPLLFQIREHPNQIVYFNQLVGGTRGAYTRYEMDYWGNCYKQAVDWMRKQEFPGSSRVYYYAHIAPHVAQLYDVRFDDIGYAEKGKPVQYSLVLLRVRPEEMRTLDALPDVVHRVEADGAPLCLVVYNREFMEAYGK